MSPWKLHDSLLRASAAEAAVTVLCAALDAAGSALGVEPPVADDDASRERATAAESPIARGPADPGRCAASLTRLRLLCEVLGPHLVRPPKHRHLVRLRELEAALPQVPDPAWARARAVALVPALTPVERPGGEWLRDRIDRAVRRELETAELERARRLLRKLRRRVERGGLVKPRRGEVPSAAAVFRSAIETRCAALFGRPSDTTDGDRNGDGVRLGRRWSRGVRELGVLLEGLPEEIAGGARELVAALSTLLREQEQLAALARFVEREHDRLAVARNASATVLPGLRGMAGRLSDQCRSLRSGVEEIVQRSLEHGRPRSNGRAPAESQDAGPQVGSYGEARTAAIVVDESAEPAMVERRFLLHGLPAALRDSLADVVQVVDEEIGLLPSQRVTEWVWREERRSSGGRAVRHLRRLEFEHSGQRTLIEEEIVRDLFETLLSLCGDARIDRRRYGVPVEGGHWSIEQYLDRDLFVARLHVVQEFGDAELPAWIRDRIEGEIVDGSEYTDLSLARERRARATAILPPNPAHV